MSTYVWSDVRERAVLAFAGELPGSAAEAAVIEIFTRHPALVVAAIEAVSEQKRAGRVRSGWAVLRKRLEADEAGASLVVTDTSDRERRIMRAEQWLRATGKHFDRAEEVLEELFDGLGGDRSDPVLKPWRSDEELREWMASLWREVRTEGERTERQALERAEAWKASTGNAWHEARRSLRDRAGVGEVAVSGAAVPTGEPERPPEDSEPRLKRREGVRA